MPANKMPEMPEPEGWLVRYGTNNECWNAYRDELTAFDVGKQWRGTIEPLFTADQMRAMYLAGIAAALSTIPENEPWENESLYPHLAYYAKTLNKERDRYRVNLTALEQEAKK